MSSTARPARRARRSCCLLHGFPSAGHMFRDLIPLLADRFHIVAPDLPGFGKSDMPDKAHTFDQIAETIDRFTEIIGFDRYAVYVFDYGAPTGFRLAVKHPERITAIISQNGNAYEEGLSDGWNPIRAYWQDASPANREALRAFLKPETTVWQYTHGVPDPTRGFAGRLFARQLLPRPARRGRGAARPVRRLQEQRRALSDLPGLFPHPQAAACWRCGARTIRSSCRRAPRRSSATSRTRSCASSIPAISRWKRMPRRSRRRSATSFPADLRFEGDVRHVRNPSPSSPARARASAGRPPSASRAISRRSCWSRATAPSSRDGGGGEGRRRRGAGHRHRSVPSPRRRKSVVDQTLAAFGRIDALLNIAGAVPQIDLFEMTDEQWDGGLALKLHGARRLTIAAWPALKEAKGSVVLMSGNSALFPKAPYAAVGTINAAIVALAKAFSDRGIADGVQVNSVLPGPVMTGRRRSYLEHWAPLHDMTVEEATAKFPQGSRHRALWRAGGDRRADGVPGLARRALDDGLDAAHGRRRGQIDLTRSASIRRRALVQLHGAQERWRW